MPGFTEIELDVVHDRNTAPVPQVIFTEVDPEPVMPFRASSRAALAIPFSTSARMSGIEHDLLLPDGSTPQRRSARSSRRPERRHTKRA